MDKKELFDWIDKNAELVVELETELTRRPAVSPESGGAGEWEKCAFLEGWLRDRGITRLERFDAPDERATGGGRPNLIATIPGRVDTGRLWIMSHLDVVPPGEASLWQSDPWKLVRRESPEGPVLVGRGVEDNQQGLCASVVAALALGALGIVPAHTVKLLFVADEENGSRYGIDWLLKEERKGTFELFREEDRALIPDSGDPQGEAIEIAEKNLLWARFTTSGAQAHGSRPNQGLNAHLAGADLAVRLHYGLSERFSFRDSLFEPDYSTFEPTKKEANVPNINTIPGEDVFYMDMRIIPRYSLEEVQDEIDRIKTEVEDQYGVKIRYTLPQAIQSRPTPADSPLVAQLSRGIREVYGVEGRPIGIGGGTVGAYLRNAGIASVVWGRIAGTAHQPNEYALLANILGDAKVMALLMAEE